jgi:hypothetical protein
MVTSTEYHGIIMTDRATSNNDNDKKSNSSSSVVRADNVVDDTTAGSKGCIGRNQTTTTTTDTNIQQRITITTELFLQCLQQYIENEKPDLLQKKQLESWNMTWTNDDDYTNDETDTNTNIEGWDDFLQQSKSVAADVDTTIYIVSGTLQIVTEYMIVYIITKCYWKGDINNGSIRFTCHVGTQPFSNTDTDTGNTGNSIKSKQSMIHRLCSDEYIQKILFADKNLERNKTNNNNVRDIVKLMTVTTNDDTFLLGTVFIDRVQLTVNDWNSNTLDGNHNTSSTSQQKELKNEERVYCNEHIGEALRRLLYSTSDASIDVLDIVFRFPYLPCTSGTSNSTGNSNTITTTTTTPLADRIQLRLLEEITYDACNNLESDNEEDIVDDLSIGDDDVDNNNNKSNNNARGFIPKKKKIKR